MSDRYRVEALPPPGPNYARGCDRCGGEVDPADDAVALDIELGVSNSWLLVGCKPRHLLPKPDRGCRQPEPGAVPGGPAARPAPAEYAYEAAGEPLVRAAYARMQARAATIPSGSGVASEGGEPKTES